MTNQADPDDDAVIGIAGKRIAGATASRKRIKAINKAMAGKTLLELRKASGPMEVALIMGHNIAGEEMMSIMDIEMAMMALSGAGMIKPVSLELKSSGKKGEWSKVTYDAVENYVAWANFWSARENLRRSYVGDCGSLRRPRSRLPRHRARRGYRHREGRCDLRARPERLCGAFGLGSARHRNEVDG